VGLGYSEYHKLELRPPFRAKQKVRIDVAAFDSTFRFHGIDNNPYPLPNDEVEKDRLDEIQLLFHTVLGTNIIAPIGPTPGQIGPPRSTSAISDPSRSWNRVWEMGFRGCKGISLDSGHRNGFVSDSTNHRSNQCRVHCRRCEPRDRLE
jgi:hypothetical protein